MDSVPQERNNRSSVFSLLNPTDEDTQNFSKRNFDESSSQANQIDGSSSRNEKRKRVRMFGVELDVPYNETPNKLLLTVHHQLELFTNNLHHVQTQEYQQQEQFFKGAPQTSTEDNNNNVTSSVDAHRTEEYQHPVSFMEYLIRNQSTHSLPSCNQLQVPPFSSSTATPQFNPCSLPSILNPPPPTYSQTFSRYDDSPNTNNLSTSEQSETQLSTKRSSTSSPTYGANKYRTVIIQTSLQDPPIEARVIIDDPKTNPFTQQWMEHFQELKNFKEQFGHTNVTRSISGYYNLGNWVAEQRRKFKQGKVTESQFNCLNQIGFEWDRSYYFFRTRHKKLKNSESSSDKESPRVE